MDYHLLTRIQVPSQSSMMHVWCMIYVVTGGDDKSMDLNLSWMFPGKGITTDMMRVKLQAGIIVSLKLVLN